MPTREEKCLTTGAGSNSSVESRSLTQVEEWSASPRILVPVRPCGADLNRLG